MTTKLNFLFLEPFFGGSHREFARGLVAHSRHRIDLLTLPALSIAAISMAGYSRFQRASMLEVMHSDYLRTAKAKGLPRRTIIIKHALRNALIAPFTVIMLQINWLLSGVIVVEFFFAYKGFGALILEASLNNDIALLEACAMVAVFVAVATQTLADIGYTFLNPRIRFS